VLLMLGAIAPALAFGAIGARLLRLSSAATVYRDAAALAGFALGTTSVLFFSSAGLSVDPYPVADATLFTGFALLVVVGAMGVFADRGLAG
jgi:hypothetical protein